MTQYGQGEGGGRQYIVWPFYAFLDRRLGCGAVHRLWHADRIQRQQSGRSKDMLSNLADQLATARHGSTSDDDVPAPPTLGTLFGEFALASLTLDWGWREEQSTAFLAAADPLDPLRFTPLLPSTPHGVRHPCLLYTSPSPRDS